MKILVTGGTTFVSRYTAEYFVRAGHEVTVMNRGSREQVKNTELVCCDRTLPGNTLEGRYFDWILDITAYTEEHISALTGSGVSFGNYLMISSSAVYPETNPQPFTEDQPCGANSVWGDYGTNKLKAEQYLTSVFPGAYILRPPYFYGLYDNIYREAFAFDCADNDREFYIPGDGSMRMQFFNVSDLCRFIEIIMEKQPQQHIFNVGNPDTVTIKEWVELCYKAAGKQPRFVEVDKAVPQRAYFCFHDYEYVLDVSAQTELMESTVSLEEGLCEEYAYYRENPESVYFRRNYIEFIDKELKGKKQK